MPIIPVVIIVIAVITGLVFFIRPNKQPTELPPTSTTPTSVEINPAADLPNDHRKKEMPRADKITHNDTVPMPTKTYLCSKRRILHAETPKTCHNGYRFTAG